MDLFVGQSSLRGEFGRYAKNLNFLELLAEPSLLPKLDKLAKYRAQAQGFAFSVVLSPRCLESGPDAERARTYGLSVVNALQPDWLVVRTPPSMRPGRASEERLEQFLSSLPAGKHRVAWDARGLWEMSTVRRVAQRLGVAPVLDASNVAAWGDAPVTGACYARLLGIGVAQRPSEGLLARFVQRILACETVFLVVDGANAIPTQKLLVTLLSELAEEADDGFDPDFDDADEGSEEDADSEDTEDDAFEDRGRREEEE